MKPKFIDNFNSQNVVSRFENLPQRIFLDTNALQYLQDFGKYIFENYRESRECFTSPKGKTISKDHPLYLQIIALHDIFININRTNLEFALSQSIFEEVIKKDDGHFIQWFYDVWDHWQSVLESYEDNPISKSAFGKYRKARIDKSLLGGLSEKDQKVVLDAIRFDCDALLTVDKFAKGNFQHFVYRKYGIMIVKPTDLFEIMKPFQALWL